MADAEPPGMEVLGTCRKAGRLLCRSRVEGCATGGEAGGRWWVAATPSVSWAWGRAASEETPLTASRRGLRSPGRPTAMTVMTE